MIYTFIIVLKNGFCFLTIKCPCMDSGWVHVRPCGNKEKCVAKYSVITTQVTLSVSVNFLSFLRLLAIGRT